MPDRDIPSRAAVLGQDVNLWKRTDRPRYLRHMAGGRDLAREMRAGVEHFVTGQHHAKLSDWGNDYFSGDPIQVGRLTFVDVMGHLCVWLVSRSAEDAAWQVTWVSRHGQLTSQEARMVQPGEFELSPKMLTALDRAGRLVDTP